MSSTYGNSTTPSSGFFYDDSGNSQYASTFGAWPGGTVTDFYVYIGGDGVSPTGEYIIWHSNGSIAFQSNSTTIGSGTRSVGGQGWKHVSSVNTYIAPDAGGLWLGIWTSGNVVWTYEGSGGAYFQRSTASPSSFSPNTTEGSGSLGAYVVYNPGQAHVMRNGSFVAGTASVMRGGTQTAGTIQVMRNGVWTPGA